MMPNKMINIFIFQLLFFSSLKSHEPILTRKINFPDISGFKTLVCDLHMHSVFSDGSVWPDIRVKEAEKDGLDVIAITEHLEYQPRKKDIPNPDRNRSFEHHKNYAKDLGILVLNGSEITRKMPPGHSNAIFIKDANKLIVDDPIDAFKEARKQDAFIFWNHPNWIKQSPDGGVPLHDLNLKLIKDGLIEGIEVVNYTTYSNEAFQLALDHNLTIIGTSDIHGLVDWRYKIPLGGHRPVTLVFSKEKTENELKNALRKGQTVVWFNKRLIGKSDFLIPLINTSLKIESAYYIKKSIVAHVVILNNSDSPYILRNLSEYDFHNSIDIITISPNNSAVIDVRTINKKRKFELKFEVLNALIAPSEHPIISLAVRPKP